MLARKEGTTRVRARARAIDAPHCSADVRSVPGGSPAGAIGMGSDTGR